MLPALVEGLGLVHAKVSVPVVSAKATAIPVSAKVAAAVLVAEVTTVSAAANTAAATPLLKLKHTFACY